MPDKGQIKDTRRELGSLMAPLEKKALLWLAARIPARINSDHLTLLGLEAMFFCGLFYYFSRQHPVCLHIVSVWLVINWFGDSLDGTLARYRNRLRPKYGFYVDHIVDMAGNLFLLGGLALSGYISPWIAAGLLIAYYMLSINAYLATYSVGTFKMSHWIFGPTELRILLIIGNTALYFRPMVEIFGGQYLLFDAGGVIGMAGMLLILIISITKNTVTLYNRERLD